MCSCSVLYSTPIHEDELSEGEDRQQSDQACPEGSRRGCRSIQPVRGGDADEGDSDEPDERLWCVYDGGGSGEEWFPV